MRSEIIVLSLAIFIDLIWALTKREFSPFRRLLDGFVLDIKKAYPKKLLSALLTLAFVAFGFSLSYLVLSYSASYSPYAYLFLAAVTLKAGISLKSINKSSRKLVLTYLKGNDIEVVRLLKRLGVKVKRLNDHTVLKGCLRITGHNLLDSLVAPIFYYVLLGVPGAIAYKCVTMVYEMTEKHGKELSWFPQILHSILAYVPQKILSVMIIVSSFIFRLNSKAAIREYRKEIFRTDPASEVLPAVLSAKGSVDAGVVRQAINVSYASFAIFFAILLPTLTYTRIIFAV